MQSLIIILQLHLFILLKLINIRLKILVELVRSLTIICDYKFLNIFICIITYLKFYFIFIYSYRFIIFLCIFSGLYSEFYFSFMFMVLIFNIYP